MYKLDSRMLHRILTYSEIHGTKLDQRQVIEFAKSLNLYKSISIVCELLSLRNKTITKNSQYLWWNLSVDVPFDGAIKYHYLNYQGPQKMDFINGAEDLLNPITHPNYHILTLQSLLIALKLLIGYGDYSSLTDNNSDITEDDYIFVIRLALMSIELLDYHDFCTEHFIYGNYHLNQINNIGSEIARAYYVYDVIARDKSLFSKNVQNEYLDFNSDFMNKYGYSITEYLSVMFLLCEHDVGPKNHLLFSPIYRDLKKAFENLTNQENAKRIVNDLSLNIYEVKGWARDSITAWWDFSKFMEHPILNLPNGFFTSICDRTLINALYEKLFWHIRECYPIESKKFNDFIGRPFEKYLQLITKQAILNNSNYKYLDEFKYATHSSTNNASSDAYIIKGNQMIIVEAKSFTPLFDSINYCDDKSITKSLNKLFIHPVLQADKANMMILSSDKKAIFENIEDIVIISVTVDSIQAVPKYINKAIEEIQLQKKLPMLSCYLNFSICEYEFLLSMIESGIDIFQVIHNYCKQSTLQPFFTYASKKTSHKCVKTKYMEKILNEATNSMELLLFKPTNNLQCK